MAFAATRGVTRTQLSRCNTPDCPAEVSCILTTFAATRGVTRKQLSRCNTPDCPAEVSCILTTFAATRGVTRTQLSRCNTPDCPAEVKSSDSTHGIDQDTLQLDTKETGRLGSILTSQRKMYK